MGLGVQPALMSDSDATVIGGLTLIPSLAISHSASSPTRRRLIEPTPMMLTFASFLLIASLLTLAFVLATRKDD
jgi:hypothetical protein